MSAARPGLSSVGFTKQFVLPALSILLVPVVGLCFFLHAENSFDADARESVFHEASLTFRFLPETDEELAIVIKAFPPLTIEGKSGTLVIDYLGLNFTGWSAKIEYREITQCSNDNGTLQIKYQRDGKQKQNLKLKTFGKRQQEVLDAIGRYWGRYQSAAAYQAQKRLEAQPATRLSPEIA